MAESAEKTYERVQTLARFRAQLACQKFVHVPDTWLDQALESFNAYVPNSAINVNHLYKKWLNTDLRKIPFQHSPYPQISGQWGQISQIQGPMVMQVFSIKDVSKPDIQDQDEDALLDVEKEQEGRQSQPTHQSQKNRSLSFKLFDGKREHRALEYLHLKGFKEEECTAGCKLLLKGNMEVSSGIILLKPGNWELLGGKS